jgi:hypothetical protein
MHLICTFHPALTGKEVHQYRTKPLRLLAAAV